MGLQPFLDGAHSLSEGFALSSLAGTLHGIRPSGLFSPLFGRLVPIERTQLCLALGPASLWGRFRSMLSLSIQYLLLVLVSLGKWISEAVCKYEAETALVKGKWLNPTSPRALASGHLMNRWSEL